MKPFFGAASMPQSQRVPINPKLQTPGPGAYDNNAEKIQQGLPKWSLKKRIEHGTCFQNTSITPGPGNYTQPQGFKKLPQTIISTKGQKYKSYLQKNYSHSAVNLPGSLNLRGGHSFGYREPFKELEKSPGPIYHLDSIIEEKRTLKKDHRLKGFGGDKKNYVKNQNDPGPGSFENQLKDSWKNKSCEAWSFGSAKKEGGLSSNELGPGEYSPKFASTMNRSFKLRGRNQPKAIESTKLGPGSYDIPDTKMKIGTKFSVPKNNVYSEQNQPKPGELLSPSTYNPPRYLDKPTNQGFTLGKRWEEAGSNGQQEPGPGSYQVAGSYIKGAGGYMGRKMEIKKKENLTMDNFYKYDPNLNIVARESPKFSFPQGRRNDKQNSNSNSYSHCFYQSLDSKSSGYYYSMGTSKRFAEMKKETGPYRETSDFSTIGQLPSYLKKGLKKK